jgi:hypothetical protein
MTLKDGSKLDVKAPGHKVEGSTAARLAVLEKQIVANAAIVDDDDSDESDGEEGDLFAGHGKPKSVQLAAAKKLLKDHKDGKRKRVNTAHVFDRLGGRSQVKARRSTDAELDLELEIDNSE